MEVSKAIMTLVNQVHEIEQRSRKMTGAEGLARSITKMRDALEELGFFYENPLGQSHSETRTDLDATIAGPGTEGLVVVEVFKPIVRQGTKEASRVVQKGIVIVESPQEVGRP